MSKRLVGMVLVLVGGLVIGWYAGSWGYSIFEKTVPAGAVTELVRGGTKAAYRTGGLFLGVVAAAYALLAAWASRFFRDTPRP
jgi:hypothetical protein